MKYLLKNTFRCLLILAYIIPVLATAQPNSVEQQLAALEKASGGRLGVSAINTANNTQIHYRSEERFPFCSTFKVIGVAAILKQSMTDSALLKQKITYTQQDIDESGYAPVTKNHVAGAGGMTISELSEAAITHSDNTAINLLIKKLGGLQFVNAFARSMGDNTFRLDRWEPALNTAILGDVRDTSTPAAMAKSLQKLALGDVLDLPQREQLLMWLKNNTTGDLRIRAGVPKGWMVGDKTGTGSYGTTNDIGIIWPPNAKPIIVAIYFTQNKKAAAPRNEVIASVMRVLVSDKKLIVFESG